MNQTLKVTRATPPPPPPAKIYNVEVTCHSGLESSRETIRVVANPSGTSHELRYSRHGEFFDGELYLNSNELRDFAMALLEVADQYPYV
jgi:hypothetical protein